MNIVYMDGKKEPYTTSEIIAECAEVTHHTIQELSVNIKQGLNVSERLDLKSKLKRVVRVLKILF